MSKIFDIPTPVMSLQERVNELPKGEKLDIIEVRVGSDSDLPKIKEILEGLADYPLLVRIASAHRTPDAMVQLSKSFPNVQVSLEGEDSDYTQVSQQSRDLCKKLNVVFCIAAAGGSAHIAGMTASDTHIPVGGYPVASSTNGQFESDASMRDMPPHKPNGVSAYESVLVQQAKAIYDFNSKSSQGVYLDPSLQISKAAQEVINLVGIEVIRTLEGSPEIGIYAHQVSDTKIDYQNYTREERLSLNANLARITSKFGTPIVITNPVYSSPMDTDDRTLAGVTRNGIIAANRLTTPGLSMSTSVNGKTNLINSLIFAAEIVAKNNAEVRSALVEHREELNRIVRGKDMAIVSQQT